MAATSSPQVRAPLGRSVQPGHRESGGYLGMLDLFRVMACAAVVANHSFIWADMSTNVIGTGFVTLLHLSRNAFFFLSGLVICYSQISHPRRLRAFWKRRYVQLGVPYLAWTGVYLVFSLVIVSLSWHEVWSFLRQNLLMGYSQLYPAFVIFQFCLVFPLLLKMLRATRRHGLIMGLSLGFGLVLGVTLHYPWLAPWATDAARALSSVVPWSRDLLTYQEFFVAGALVALHFDDVCTFVRRHMRKVFVVSAAAGGLMVLWYAVQVGTGTSLLRASDAYQPEAVVWYFAAIAAMFAWSLWWDSRPQKNTGRLHPGWTTSAGLGALTGGVWLSHNLFLTSLRSLLGATGLRSALPWEATVAILFVGTVVISGTFVSLVLRTRLRWVLGGPVRAEQRAEYEAFGAREALVRRRTEPVPAGDEARRGDVGRVGPHGTEEVEGAGAEWDEHDHERPAQTRNGMAPTQQV
jgi:peptidoglycan/LPS O-acetylase OafA/YrhL